MFVNSILVYDNELVVICNVGKKQIILMIDLMEDIKSKLVTNRLRLLNGSVHHNKRE